VAAQEDLRKGTLRRHPESAAPTRSVSPSRQKSSRDASPTVPVKRQLGLMPCRGGEALGLLEKGLGCTLA
jgi:hypothetical protein